MTKRFLLTLILLVVMVALIAWDIASDLSHGSSLWHIVTESCVILLGIVAISTILAQIRASYVKAIKRSEEDLRNLRIQAETWKNEAKTVLQGLSLQIDQQFCNWHFSSGEKDIALLLIKGFSIKEIALLRNVQEKTVRQQCSAIYKKSGLAGRAELAAFFLEDLLLPN